MTSRRLGYTLLTVLLTACGGEPLTIALSEPIRISGAQFHEGNLPGATPLSAKQLAEGVEQDKPYSSSVDVAGRVLTQNEPSFSLSGRTSDDAYAIAFQAEDYGTGYWLLPVGSPDPNFPGELTWRARLDLGPSIGTGLRTLLVAAIDGEGNSGTQGAFEFCVQNPVDDNLNSCLPSQKPPALVVSLGWQSAGDLDLRIVDSNGASIDSHHPLGDSAKIKGRLTHDANANCVAETAPRENVIWTDKPPAGTYYVYVNLNSACGESAVPFVVTTHVSQKRGKEFEQVESFRVSGELLSLQANNTGLGTFVTELSVE